MTKNPIANERGDLTTASIFLIMEIVMVMTVLMSYIGVQGTVSKVKGSVKQELNNLSATIAKDTYKAMRESSTDEYKKILTSDSYKNTLINNFESGLAKALPTSDKYYIYNGKLTFSNDDSRITYTYQCSVLIFVKILEKTSIINKNVSISGSHQSKYNLSLL